MGDEGQQALSMPRQDDDVVGTPGGFGDSTSVDVGDNSLDGPAPGLNNWGASDIDHGGTEL